MTDQPVSNRLKYSDLALPNYRNTRNVFANLDVSDLVKAAVLAPVNILLVGDKGTGKSQLATDIYNAYFNGNKVDGGHGILIRANPDTDIHNEVFSNLNLTKAQRELTSNLEALVCFVGEINRAPPVAQNQFFSLGDGVLEHRGKSHPMGRNKYHLLIATANLGNGQFQGTFETDEAMYNRLHLAVDFDYGLFEPTEEDESKLNRKKADPNIVLGEKKDLSDKIIAASEEIKRQSEDQSLETEVAIDYLTFALNNCQRNLKEGFGNSKGKMWPVKCQDCSFNPKGEALCASIKKPVRRTIESIKLYNAALRYLIELKDPGQKLDHADSIFKAFELTGAYQSILNPQILKTEYQNQNPLMMADVVKKLRRHYEEIRKYIVYSYEEAKEGKKSLAFFKEKNGRVGEYSRLSDKVKEKLYPTPTEPFKDNQEIGLGYVERRIEREVSKVREAKEKEQEV